MYIVCFRQNRNITHVYFYAVINDRADHYALTSYSHNYANKEIIKKNGRIGNAVQSTASSVGETIDDIFAHSDPCRAPRGHAPGKLC